MDDLMKAEFSNLVKFVKPSSDKADSESCKGHLLESNCKQPLSGNDAVLFYKDIISSHSGKSKDRNSSGQSDDTSLEQVNPKRHKRGQQEMCKQPSNTLVQCQNLNVGTFLTSSQNGDLARVEACLTAGVDVNSQDRFGWTALMCAACSGQRRVIKQLLSSGANTHLTASGGKTAASIASDAGHCGIMKLISDFDLSKREVIDGRTRSSSTGTNDLEVQTFYCDVCKQDIKEASQTHHQTSTVHLFNKKVKAKPHSFLEHSRNKGYQIMRRTGWDGEKGLGSEGQGQKFPVKTVIKKDRACLGSDRSKEKAKVTHFGPRDISAVKRNVHVTERKMSARTLSKRAQKAKERKLNQWEKKLRFEFNLND